MAEKKTLSAKEVVADIRAGATDEFLMKKYGINEKGLQSLFQKLITAKAITQAELDRRVEEVEAVLIEDEAKLPAATSTQTVFKCPACGLPQSYDFKVCPQCGIIIEKFLRKETNSNVVEEPAKEPTKQPEQSEHEVVEPTPKPIETSQEKLRRVGAQAVDIAKELRDRVVESSAWAKLLEFIKVPRNAAVAGVVGTILVVFIGHLILSRSNEPKPGLTVAQTVTEPTPPMSVPAQREPERSVPDIPRTTYETPTRYTENPSEYPKPQIMPQVQQRLPENEPPYRLAKPRPKPVPKQNQKQTVKKFSSMEEAKRVLKCKEGSDLVAEFYASDGKEVEQLMAKSGSSLYYFTAEVRQASRNIALCGNWNDFGVNLTSLPLSFDIPNRGNFLDVIGVVTSVLSFTRRDRDGEYFCPVVTPIVIQVAGREIYQIK